MQQTRYYDSLPGCRQPEPQPPPLVMRNASRLPPLCDTNVYMIPQQEDPHRQAWMMRMMRRRYVVCSRRPQHSRSGVEVGRSSEGEGMERGHPLLVLRVEDMAVVVEDVAVAVENEARDGFLRLIRHFLEHYYGLCFITCKLYAIYRYICFFMNFFNNPEKAWEIPLHEGRPSCGALLGPLCRPYDTLLRPLCRPFWGTPYTRHLGSAGLGGPADPEAGLCRGPQAVTTLSDTRLVLVQAHLLDLLICSLILASAGLR